MKIKYDEFGEEKEPNYMLRVVIGQLIGGIAGVLIAIAIMRYFKLL